MISEVIELLKAEARNVINYGRQIIYTNTSDITADNLLTVLEKAYLTHLNNSADIQYLWDYYKGKQPILQREKTVRPEINNKIVENRANEIVSFKTGYLMGEPLQYVSRGARREVTDAVTRLNDYVFGEEKQSKDKELADWFHICGTSYRMVLPDAVIGEEDESPFEIYTPDPRNTFVAYNNNLDRKPVLGVTYVTNEDGATIFSCYTTDYYYETDGANILLMTPNSLGRIPIIEYPLNQARLGAFEIVLPLLDAINNAESNCMDNVEQVVQALLVFYNIDITSDDYDELKQRGGIKVSDTDTGAKGRVEYLINSLNQNDTQVMIDNLYESVLTICGMPNRNGGSSTSDTGSAVIMRDGWSSAEARAKDTELVFKRSEREFLKIVLDICRVQRGLELKVSDIEIRFTRRNYENILQKAQVLTLMLSNEKIHPELAFAHSGMFVDAELAYKMSMEYYEENKTTEVVESDTDNNEGIEGTDREPLEEGEQSGVAD